MSENFYRTLIRINWIYNAEDSRTKNMRVTIPAWSALESILIPKNQVPNDVWDQLIERAMREEAPIRVHARVNYGEDQAKDLRFKDWEC